MPNLPEPLSPERHPVHPSLIKAAASPAALAATAVGAGVGVLDHSLPLAVILAVVGWTGRMAAAIARRRRRERRARPRPTELDPWSVPEPWRQLLQQALSAQERFDQAVGGWPPGPTRDRLLSLQPRVYEEVSQLGVTARRGAAAAGWTGATLAPGRPDQDALAKELREVQAERARLGGMAPERSVELERREEAVAAQLRALHRAAQAQSEIHDRLRAAVARLDETVTELLLVDAAGTSAESGGLSNTLEELTDGITTLHQALTEATGAPPEEERRSM